ncbi:hypothetical protein DH2020_012813 [Rehmannia glutinosa]|uniref:Sm protein B n=1 Tax=Rehmannia glutinosa TaxID=99300 RepID=A0ABR0X165_REHGL
MMMSKSSKMLQYINYRMRVTIQDGRQLIGKFMAFDRYMNLILGDCEEFRKLPPTKGSKEEREDRARSASFSSGAGNHRATVAEVLLQSTPGPPGLAGPSWPMVLVGPPLHDAAPGFRGLLGYPFRLCLILASPQWLGRHLWLPAVGFPPGMECRCLLRRILPRYAATRWICSSASIWDRGRRWRHPLDDEGSTTTWWATEAPECQEVHHGQRPPRPGMPPLPPGGQVQMFGPPRPGMPPPPNQNQQ